MLQNMPQGDEVKSIGVSLMELVLIAKDRNFQRRLHRCTLFRGHFESYKFGGRQPSAARSEKLAVATAEIQDANRPLSPKDRPQSPRPMRALPGFSAPCICPPWKVVGIIIGKFSFTWDDIRSQVPSGIFHVIHWRSIYWERPPIRS